MGAILTALVVGGAISVGVFVAAILGYLGVPATLAGILGAFAFFGCLMAIPR